MVSADIIYHTIHNFSRLLKAIFLSNKFVNSELMNCDYFLVIGLKMNRQLPYVIFKFHPYFKNKYQTYFLF